MNLYCNPVIHGMIAAIITALIMFYVKKYKNTQNCNNNNNINNNNIDIVPIIIVAILVCIVSNYYFNNQIITPLNMEKKLFDLQISNIEIIPGIDF